MTKITSSPPLDAAIHHIVTLVGQARDRSFRAANTELVNLYWSVGQYLSHQCQHEGWGQGTVKTLSQLLQTRQPGWKGFSAQNLWRMTQFFETYEGDAELSTLLRELPWSAILHLLVTKLKLFLTKLGRDHEVVEYAFSPSLSPALVAQYTTQLQPTILLLQANLAELFELDQQARERGDIGEPDDE